MMTSAKKGLPTLAASLLLGMSSATLFAGQPGQAFESLDQALSRTAAPEQASHIKLRGEDPDERATYIIRLHEPPAARYRGGIPGLKATSNRVTGAERFDASRAEVRAYRDYLQTRQQEVIAGIAAETGVFLQPERQWQLALNAFAVEIDLRTARQIAAMPEVAHIKREIVYQPLTFIGPEYINATPIWSGELGAELETRGEGVVIGIVDSGIQSTHESFAAVASDGYEHVNPLGAGNYIGVCDPEHDDFDDSYACNDKLIGSFFFGSAEDAHDENGHGTHVAGTAAGNPVTTPGGIPLSGVAPRANIVNYRICAGGCTGMPDVAEDILERGLVDVINYSIGPVSGGGDPYWESSAAAFLSLNEAGVTTFAAGGNSGPGAETISNFGPWNVTVGSSHHGGSFITPASVTGPEPVPADLEDMATIPSSGLFLPEAIDAELVDADAVDSGNYQACNALPEDSMLGMIGVAEVGGCPFADKAVNMADAGAVAAIYYSGDDYGDHGIPAMGGDFPIPAVWVDYPVSLDLIAWVNDEDDASGRLHATEMVQQGADVMSGFSSRGPGNAPYGMLPGPDVVAPGHNVLAAYVGDDDEYVAIGGTSMASPHAAGAGALLRALKPDWTPTELQSALMLTADIGVLKKEDGSTPADIFDQGSGRVNVANAARTGLLMDETYDNFVDADPNGGSLELHELNVPFLTRLACDVAGCSWTRTLTATHDGSWTVIAGLSGGDIQVSPANFSLVEGESQEITVTVSGGSGSDWHFGGVLIEEDSSASSRAHLPVAVTFDGEEAGPDTGDRFDLDGVSVPGGQGNALEIELVAPRGELAGIDWELNYSTASGAWRDEFRMEIIDPDGERILAGGAADAWDAPPGEVLDYDFGWPSSGGSSSDSRSIDDFDGQVDSGVWTVRLWGTYAVQPHGTLTDDSFIQLNIDQAVPAPSLDPEGGTWMAGDSVDVTITVADTDMTIHYTTDGSEPDQASGTEIASGESIEISETTTLKAVAFDPDGSPDDISIVVAATYHFYDEVSIEDENGDAIEDMNLAAGDRVRFYPSGGSGDFSASALNVTTGESANVVDFHGAFYEFEVPAQGAFAGDYTIELVDDETGASVSFTVSVDLGIDSRHDYLVANGDSTEVRVRGATAGYGFSLLVEDADGQDGSAIASMDPADVSADDDHGSANAARSHVVSAGVSEATAFQIRAVPSDGTYGEVVLDGLTVDVGETYAGWIHNELGHELADVQVATPEAIGPAERQYMAFSDGDGVFTLTAPAPEGEDSHALSFTLPGYVSEVVDGADCVGDTPQCDVVLQSASAEINGSVIGLEDGESVNLYLVYQGGADELELGPVVINGSGEGEDAFQLDANYQATYAEIRVRGFGYEDFSDDQGGDGFSFAGMGDAVDAGDLALMPTTPVIESATVVTAMNASATIAASIDSNERASVITLNYGSSADDLDSSLEEVTLSAEDGLVDLEFEISGLECDQEVFYEISVANDRGHTVATDPDNFVVQCASSGGGSGGSCSLGDGRGPVDPLLPLIALMAMLGLLARRRV
ncbi:S8 family serine peptidase [Natronospira bacteriovora]|uniref:S8 family serine peptidase n=1 Tax=Natronospira bacteriovora TaxID=3069753 RepID=A0ABU0W7Z7_9GAMM|nr:S8 family serine peptidase [Natronospira sp. AB-CW4]MDQ2070162.1 S8 family serine peptidase [Natronospira sp. AB-CW4]